MANWIKSAIKHPGRCAKMGSESCPAGSPQYNLAKRFKSGDLHKKKRAKRKSKNIGDSFTGKFY